MLNTTTAQQNKKEYKKAVDCAISNVKEYFPNYRKNKYFYKSLKGIYLILFNKATNKIVYLINLKSVFYKNDQNKISKYFL